MLYVEKEEAGGWEPLLSVRLGRSEPAWKEINEEGRVQNETLFGVTRVTPRSPFFSCMWTNDLKDCCARASVYVPCKSGE